jgi:hypothetical protein
MRNCNKCGKIHSYQYSNGKYRSICGSCNTKYTPQYKYKSTHQYCENRDGRLGDYKCDATIRDVCQLELDHKDGNPHNNDESNWQVLCRNCHAYKGKQNGDHLTPGRKKSGRTSR